MIYLDYSATTPVNDEVIESYSKACKEYIGNPNSLHRLGLESKKVIDAATAQIASILNVKPSEIIYTSGASEANNTAIKGVAFKYKKRGNKIISTELEHSSVIGPLNYLSNIGFDVEFVKLDSNGRVDLDDFKRLIDDNTILVTIASVNSEVGIKQPIKEISEIVKNYPKCLFHSDMTQSIGKEYIDLSLVDMASFSAQKFYGMKGVGGLIKKENIVIDPLIHGGKSTTIWRSGTPALPLIVSTARALRLIYDDFDNKLAHIKEVHDYLIDKLRNMDVDINSNENCINQIVNYSLRGIKSEVMLHALEEDDIFVSTQTACSTGNYSIAIYALTHDEERSSSSMRVSISHLTTKEEIDKFIESLSKNIEKLGELKK
ncbi:MAG: cysteine desulfurase [Bacilli bacterium]|nr:cysteine desulfurase [Bacilli bacterium]